MKSKFLTAIAVAFLPVLVSATLFSSVLAVKADTTSGDWEGANASGAIVKGEDSPVIVEKETLDFHIASLPREGKVESGYTSEAVAEYVFYNPTEDDYDMTLLFPFGVFPSYVASNATDEISAVSVGGESAECRVRHSYASSTFSAEKDIERVLDEKKADAFYGESTPVNEYRIILAPNQKREGGTLNLKLSYNPRRTRIIFPTEGTRLYVSGGDMYATVPLEDNSSSILFYAFGAPIFQVSSAGKEEVSPLEPAVTEMTFARFAMMGWSAGMGVSEVDWYNAVVDMLNDKNVSAGATDAFGFTSKNLMRWYEYDMKIPAGERVVSRVKTPLYPTVEGNKNPRYEYSYLLSPAAKWADFQSLEICIKTPYLLASGSLNFTKEQVGDGYAYSFTRSSLPQGELTFVLMESEDADSDFNVFDRSFLRPSTTWAFVTLTCLAGVATVITVVAIVTFKKKNR